MKKDRKQCLEVSMLHYVKPPENHIVIDFDIPRDDGAHLHYICDGDTTLFYNGSESRQQKLK